MRNRVGAAAHGVPRPNTEILARSWLVARDRYGAPLGPSARWIIGPPQERRNSLLFPLVALGTNGVEVRAFYKAFRPIGNNADIHARKLSALLRRMPHLNQRFEEAAGRKPILSAPLLAVDPAGLVLVTMAVGDGPIGKAWGQRARPGGISIARCRYHRIGEAIAIIEQCTDDSAPHADESIEKICSHLLRRGAAIFSGAEFRRFSSFVDALSESAACAAPRAVYAHCDLSSSNIVKCGPGIGLIDFSWLPALPTYDLACFVVRLQYEMPWPSRLGQTLIREVLRGYGDKGLSTSPAWAFNWVHRTMAVASLGRPKGVLDPRAGQAKRAIRDAMREGVASGV